MDKKTKAIKKTIEAILKNCKKDRTSYYNIGINTGNDTAIITDTFRIFETVADTTEAAPDVERIEADNFIVESLNRTESRNFDRVYFPDYSELNKLYKEIKSTKPDHPIIINFNSKFTLDAKLFLEVLQAIDTHVILYNGLRQPVYLCDDISRAAIMPIVKEYIEKKKKITEISSNAPIYIYCNYNGQAEIIDHRPKAATEETA